MGKDSLATQLKLIELYGKDSVLPVMFSSNHHILWEPLHGDIANALNPDINIIECGNEVYYNKLDLFMNKNNYNATEYFLSTGEIDNVNEICMYYPVIRKYGYKGWVNPFFGKPKQLLFNTLQQYDCKFMFTRAILPNETFRESANELIGKIVNVNELKQLYDTNPALFFSMQTIAVQCSYFNNSNITKVNKLINDFNTNKNLSECVISM